MARRRSSQVAWSCQPSALAIAIVSVVACTRVKVESPCCQEQSIPRPPAPTAEQEKRSLEQRVESSGAPAPQDLATLQKAADLVFQRTFAPFLNGPISRAKPAADCFKAGCLVQVVYADRCSQLTSDQAISGNHSAAILRWPGTFFRTAVVPLGDGRLGATWGFLLPQASVTDRLQQILKEPDTAPSIPSPVPGCPAQTKAQ
jgi:hypothetical protein